MNFDDATAEDFTRALLKLRDDEEAPVRFTSVHGMLRAQVLQPDGVTTPAELAATQQWKTSSTAAVAYGKIAQRIASYLDMPTPPKSPKDKKPMWWLALSTSVDGAEDKWTMRPALREAIVGLRWDR